MLNQLPDFIGHDNLGHFGHRRLPPAMDRDERYHTQIRPPQGLHDQLRQVAFAALLLAQVGVYGVKEANPDWPAGTRFRHYFPCSWLGVKHYFSLRLPHPFLCSALLLHRGLSLVAVNPTAAADRFRKHYRSTTPQRASPRP